MYSRSHTGLTGPESKPEHTIIHPLSTPKKGSVQGLEFGAGSLGFRFGACGFGVVVPLK